MGSENTERTLLKLKKNPHTPQKENLSLKCPGSALGAPWIFNQRPSHITTVLSSLDWRLNTDEVTDFMRLHLCLFEASFYLLEIEKEEY